MLNTANIILICVNITSIVVKAPIYPVARIIVPLISAKIKLDAGPANAIFIISIRGLLKWRESTGTGLAHPKPTKRIMSEPNISRCAKGFNVNLPAYFAVGSPSWLATQAWENSWNTSANTKTGINNMSTSGDNRNNINQTLDERCDELPSGVCYPNGYKSVW